MMGIEDIFENRRADMDTVEIEKNVLAKKIKTAFAGVQYPGNENMYGAYTNRYGLENLIAESDKWGNNWENISSELLNREACEIPILSPSAYVFFLPAFLLASLNAVCNQDDPYTTLLMFVIYNLCLDIHAESEFYELKLESHSLLNPDQRNAIKCFLKFVSKFADDEEFFELANNAIQSHYWCDCT